MILSLIGLNLALTLLDFVLDALFGQVKALNILIFALSDFLGPLRVTSIELLQELLFGLLQLGLGPSQVLVDRLDCRVGLVQSLTQS